MFGDVAQFILLLNICQYSWGREAVGGAEQHREAQHFCGSGVLDFTSPTYKLPVLSHTPGC
jgi:hypothetical protein